MILGWIVVGWTIAASSYCLYFLFTAKAPWLEPGARIRAPKPTEAPVTLSSGSDYVGML